MTRYIHLQPFMDLATVLAVATRIDPANTWAGPVQVDRLLAPDVFSRPQAILSVHIAGLETGAIRPYLQAIQSLVALCRHNLIEPYFWCVAADELMALGGGASYLSVTFEAPQQSPGLLLGAVNKAAGVHEPGFVHQTLDYTSLPGCSDACIEEALKVPPSSSWLLDAVP